ncbi:MAG: hypothetical protein JWN78_3000 [Bacteroidota bacterium]|nr:hypothetical protein [Bacteroidota bacterium]
MEFFKNPGFILRITTAICYIVLGGFLFAHPTIITFISKQMNYAFAAVLIIYGLFRAYRAYHFYKDEE